MVPITITSDFGLQNHYVASVKGKILVQIPDAILVDISHNIAPFNLLQACYVFQSSIINFPYGSIHFILNDLHASTSKKLLYAFENGHHIFCADNGMMSLLFDTKPVKIYQLKEKTKPYNYLNVTELFASYAALILQKQDLPLISVDVKEIMVKKPSYIFEQNNAIVVPVMYIDQYGNVILNIKKEEFLQHAKNRKFKILFMRDEELTTLHETYSDVNINEIVGFFNANDYLEIAVNKGNAAALFGFQEMRNKNLFYTHVTISFE